MRLAATMMAVALIVVGNGAQAGEAAGTASARPEREGAGSATLLLEIVLNGRATSKIVKLLHGPDQDMVQADELVPLGIRLKPGEIDSEGNIDVAHLEGLHSRIADTTQQLMLEAEAARLEPAVFDLATRAAVPALTKSSFGLSLAYDASIETDDLRAPGKSLSGGLNLGLNAYGPGWIASSTQFARVQAGQWLSARLDSAVEFDDQASLRKLVAGGVSWSRGLRFGGVQFARDFSLRPDLLVQPLPSFFGKTDLPGAVDVFVGAARVLETDVNAGPFEIHNIPVITGAGQATVVLHDVLGRETSQVLSLYTTPRLLAKGLTSYELDAGFLRLGYGENSFSYGTFAGSSTIRWGMTDALTLEAHSEFSPHLLMLGGGPSFSVGTFGAASFDAAVSHSEFGTGGLISASFDALLPPFSLFASFSGTAGDFADLAGGGRLAPSQLRYQLGAAASFSIGTFNLGWIGIKQPEARSSTTVLSAGYSLPFGKGRYFALNALNDMSTGHWSAGLFVSIPLNGQASAAMSFTQDRRSTALASVQSPADSDGGFGYRVAAGNDPIAPFHADASYIGEKERVDGSFVLNDRGSALRAGVSGALFMMGDSIFAGNRADGAVALVQTGEKNIRVYRENREAGRSDDNGEVLVTGLVPFAANRISIETRDFPFSVSITGAERVVVPQRGSGVLVEFTPESHRAAIVKILMPDGMPPSVGAPAALEATSEDLIVGRDGKIYIPEILEDRDLTIGGPAPCHVHIGSVPEPDDDRIPTIGPLTCILNDAQRGTDQPVNVHAP